MSPGRDDGGRVTIPGTDDKPEPAAAVYVRPARCEAVRLRELWLRACPLVRRTLEERRVRMLPAGTVRCGWGFILTMAVFLIILTYFFNPIPLP